MRTLLECYKILEEYPNGMTKDQFYRVARINKQHAKYLLDFGLVPCINTGKKTRKYHIATHCVTVKIIPKSIKCQRAFISERTAAPNGTRTSLPQRLYASILQSRKKQGCIPCGKSSRLDMMIC